MKSVNVCMDGKFYGNEISPYGKQHNRVDYATLSSVGNLVLCNEAMWLDEYWFENVVEGDNLVNGEVNDLDEICQTYIIDKRLRDVLCKHTNEVVWFWADLGVYLWCVKHFGTAWDYVLTDIKIDDSKE